MLVPRVGNLIAGLLKDPRVAKADKAALAGFASRLVAGAGLVGLGPLDDLLLSVILCDGVLARLDQDALRLHWKGDAASLARLKAWSARLAWLIPASVKRRALAPEDPRGFAGGAWAPPGFRRR